MASFMNASDAIAAAVEIERRGHNFYQAVAELAPNYQDKDFFLKLALEESRHEKVFGDMLQRIGGLKISDATPDAEYMDYVTDLLNSHSLFVADQQHEALMSPFARAMQFEKDTLLFFIELERLVPEAEKQHVQFCADEERKHIRRLNQYMKEFLK